MLGLEVKNMSYKEMEKLILKPWIDTYGIMQLAECGKNTAIKIRMEIEQSIINSGLKVPIARKKKVPTRLVLEYLGLDENYILQMANY